MKTISLEEYKKDPEAAYHGAGEHGRLAVVDGGETVMVIDRQSLPSADAWGMRLDLDKLEAYAKRVLPTEDNIIEAPMFVAADVLELIAELRQLRQQIHRCGEYPHCLCRQGTYCIIGSNPPSGGDE